jgi:hypothetical protein
MPLQSLNPGDRVVELAALVQSAAIVSGSVAGAWVFWLITRSWMVSVGGFFAGAVLGYGIAQVIVRLFYRTAEGNVAVVKVGSASLSSVIPAGLAGGISTAVLVALVSLLVFSATNQAVSLLGISVGCGVVIGIVFACLSSLT